MLVPVMVGCGQGADPDSSVDSERPAVPDTLILSVTDTIGLEMGDSCYVFGQLMKAGHGTDGSVIALDMQQARLCVYSPEGVFTGYIGAPGPGPGEFQVPINFAVLPEDGVVVTDAISRVLSFFDGEGAYTHMMSGFFPTPPMRIEGAPGNAIVGQHMPMIMTGETLEMSMELSRWTTEVEPDLTFMSIVMQMDFDNGGAEIQRGPEFEFTVGPDGSVFAAEISDTLLQVSGYSPEGEVFLSISEPMERVPMTEEEIDAGGLGMSIMIGDEGASADMSRVENTYPWRNIVAAIGVDSLSRVWLELAYLDQPVFRVYDYSGTLLFVAVPEDEFPQVGRPTFRVDAGGMLAFDRDPVDYPKIYRLRLEEN